MPSFSSDQMLKEWVYAIKQDFHSADGSPAAYAPGAPLYWDSEGAKVIPKGKIEYEGVAVNSDATLIAIVVGNEIYVYDTDKLNYCRVLKGHASPIAAVAFQSQAPHKLVSCSVERHNGSAPQEPEIIVWDLDDPQLQARLESDAAIRTLAGRALSSISAGLDDSGSKWKLDNDEKDALLQDLQKSIGALNVKYTSSDLPHISGRLTAHFQSEMFSYDGRSLIYLPGPSPRSNSDAPWDVCIWDTIKKEVRLTLKGHTDGIMWTGFSPDDKLIGTVSWDTTNRIWDAESGKLLHIFTTTGQNWTGAFSPDSNHFASTCGAGDVFIWDLATGEQIASYKYGNWCRALDWSPDGKHLAMGGKNLGRIVIFDVKSKTVVQERILSVEKCPEESQYFIPNFLEVQALKYLPGGRKIAYQTSGDDGVEVYDFVDNRKWRFAPPQGEMRAHGWGFVFLPRQGAIASIAGDALRIWDLPPSEGDEWDAPVELGSGKALVEPLRDWVVMH